MTWDRFDICEAFYMHAVMNAGSMWGAEYAIHARLDRMRYKPSPLLRGPEDLNENAREIYDQLAEGSLLVRIAR